MNPDVVALNSRVEALALALTGQRDPNFVTALSSGKTLIQGAKDLRSQYSQLPVISDFQRKYETIQELLESNQMGLPIQAKAEIVLTAENVLKDTCDTMKTLNDLKYLATDDVVPDLAGKLKTLAPIQQTHTVQQLEVARNQQRINHLVDSYNQTLDAITAQLLEWDKKLTAWEAKAK